MACIFVCRAVNAVQKSCERVARGGHGTWVGGSRNGALKHGHPSPVTSIFAARFEKTGRRHLYFSSALDSPLLYSSCRRRPILPFVAL